MSSSSTFDHTCQSSVIVIDKHHENLSAHLNIQYFHGSTSIFQYLAVIKLKTEIKNIVKQYV